MQQSLGPKDQKQRQRTGENDEVETEEQELAGCMRVLCIDELGQEGQEEQDDLGVGQIDANAEAKRAPERRLCRLGR